MIKIKTAIFFLVFLTFAGPVAFTAEKTTSEGPCPTGSGQVLDSRGVCVEPGILLLPAGPDGNSILRTLSGSKETKGPRTDNNYPRGDKLLPAPVKKKVIVNIFWGKGCPHCEHEKRFFNALVKESPAIVVRDYEVWYNQQNAALLAGLLEAHGMNLSGVPITFIDEQVVTGFSAQSQKTIEGLLSVCSQKPCVDPLDILNRKIARSSPSASPVPGTVTNKRDTDTPVEVPLLGKLDVQGTSLPVLTLVIAGLDSINPCAFFVLLSLLGLLVHARSRNRMLLIGGVFVFFSGCIYFLFMAAWLNLFLVMGQVAMVTTIAGVVSVIIAGINIKDFFLFKQGVSLTIPDSAKPGLFDRMRRLMRATSLLSMLAGTTVLAIVANSYELLCTAGFPMVFTRILTLHSLSTTTYYLYLVLYNIVYVIPLFFIVLVFTITLGSRKLSERQGRILKLVSGAMMLGLGGVLLLNPALLSSVTISFVILASALAGSLLVAMVTKRFGY
jgi:thiol-disulfide isomerase/thioredoxin